MTSGPDVGGVTVKHCDSNGTWLIALSGEHDLSTTPLIEKATGDIWSRCSTAVIDVSQTTFIDSSVINWLVRSRDALAATGQGAVRLVYGPPSTPAARLVKQLGLPDMIACYPTRDEALANTSTLPGDGLGVIAPPAAQAVAG